MNLINLVDFKNLRKVKRAYKELKAARKVIIDSLTNLDKYERFYPIKDCLSALNDNKVLIEIHINKFERALKNK